jgi:hypothetical protein
MDPSTEIQTPGSTALPSRAQRPPIAWINTPVLMAAIERYEQGWLPHSMVLWLLSLLEIEAPVSAPLRRRGC